MKTTNDEIFGCIGQIASLALLLTITTTISGWALSVLWGWFIVPVFGLPTLSVIQAIGVTLIINRTKNKPAHDDRKTSDKSIENVSYGLIMPLLSVGIGWIVLQFM